MRSLSNVSCFSFFFFLLLRRNIPHFKLRFDGTYVFPLFCTTYNRYKLDRRMARLRWNG